MLESVFAVIKSNQNIDKSRIFEHDFLYTAYADDTTFFVKNQTSAIEILKVFDNSPKIFGLKLNKKKSEIAGIGTLKGVRVALCSMQCIIINEETVKILGINFSHNKKLEEEKSFNNHIAKIENVLRVWRMRDLTIEGKIVIFKSLAISKIVHLALIKTVPISRGGCRGLPLLPMQHPEMAHINFQSSAFGSKKSVNKILKLD